MHEAIAVSPTTWWDRATTIGAALATIALTVFAAVQLWREWNGDKRRERAATVKISAAAYLLRRQLLSWIGNGPDNENHFETWIRAARNTEVYEAQLDLAIERIGVVMGLVDDAPEPIGYQLRDAYVLLLEGIRRLDSYAKQRRPSTIAIFDWIQLQAAAHADFRDCVLKLEVGVIDERLLAAETALQKNAMRKNRSLNWRMNSLPT